MTDTPERDLIGYGGQPPDVRWPGDARLCISIGVNYEEGAEYTYGDDGRHDAQGEVGSGVPDDERDMYGESLYEYGSRVGIWRLMDILDDHEVPATFYLCGRAIERNPAVAAAVVARGHEPCGHGYRWRAAHAMTEDEEREDIRRCVQAIETATGRRPLGWLTRYSASTRTRRLLREEGGFVYDLCAFNDDLPYYTEVVGAPWLVLPYSLENNDARCWRGSMLDAAALEDSFKRSFDTLHREGARGPKMMSVGLHCRIAGTPGRASAVTNFLSYAKSHDGVWFARREEIARWWLEHQPPAGLDASGRRAGGAHRES